MKRRLLLFISLWALLLALMIIHKIVFMTVEDTYTWSDFASLWPVIVNGFSMDLSMSAYLMAPVLLWLIASVWTAGKWMRRTLNIYLWFIAAVFSAVAVTDAILYPYWHFRLDATPVFYFTTSPGAALASLQWWWEMAAVILVIALAWGLHWLMKRCAGVFMPLPQAAKTGKRVVATAILLVIGALMIIPIRGGVTVSTMSPGRAYFSSDMRLNHAAVNPMFSFIHSLMHIDRLDRQFKYFDSEEAHRTVARMMDARSDTNPDSGRTVKLSVSRPDVYIIILESFSAHLMPSLGGENIATRLDSIGRRGVLFTNFYAESFRTDRALPTILSGYPALPTTSVLRYPNKFGSLPGLASELKKNGYTTSYYYGGDINFTNLKAYLVSTGFDNIVCDTDFPVSRRLSKWGAHDEDVYARALNDIHDGKPTLRVIQTSSSHEPFEVPYRSHHTDERANAFAYADSCLGAFITGLHQSGQWDRSLIAIIPDHWGAYPKDLTDHKARHHVPLVLTGGALEGTPARITAPGSQSAIVPTLLSLMGMDTSAFLYPTDLLNPAAPHHAWLTEPEWAELIKDDCTTTTINVTGNTQSGPHTKQAKAFIQTIYEDLDRR